MKEEEQEQKCLVVLFINWLKLRQTKEYIFYQKIHEYLEYFLKKNI